MSARLSACISAAPTGPISVKFDAFCENVSSKSKYGYNRVKMAGHLLL
jgi:hypothetical protein